MRRALLALLLATSPALAQERVDAGTGAILRGLDKINGSVTDLDMTNGSVARFGRLVISLSECRYPTGDPAADAYAFVTIHEVGHEDAHFSGWMFASSPALNALDHPRYDVWVMRCKTPE